MANQRIQLKPFGESAILIDWPTEISRKLSGEVLALHNFLLQQKDWGITDSIPAYHSLLVEFDESKVSRIELEARLMEQLASSSLKKQNSKLWHIPVEYSGVDVDLICEAKKITKDQLISLHTSPEYFVHFLGFLPGFLYLGELPEALHFARRSTPRARVPKGAVAIGGQQTGIYPIESPGGWHIIGNTTFEWFSVDQDPLSIIRSGDRIKFKAI